MNLCDKDYLFLDALERDLRQAVAALPAYKTVVDVGSTWKPYQHLFAPCAFLSADIGPNRGVDYVIEGAHHMPEIKAGSVDVVLCTQVLEHVPDPTAALAEFWRILRPGGHLILSTHGVFHHHPYPHDYWRWTAEGLEKIISERFEVVGIKPNGGTILLIAHIIGRGFVFMAERRWWLKWLQYTVYPLINLIGKAADRLLPDRSLSLNYVVIAQSGKNKEKI